MRKKRRQKPKASVFAMMEQESDGTDMSTDKEYDVTALGELLVDFTDSGVSEQGNPLLEANPGGAPCNVLSMLEKMGSHTAFIGKVGNDGFGKLLANAVKEQGIDIQGLRYDSKVHTTLALVLKTADGDRDFSFYRKPGADIELTEKETDTALIAHSRIFHFGSLSLTDEPVRSATHLAIQTAEENGLIITFDPNLREPLWNSLAEAHEQISWGLRHAHALKISDNEIQWFTSCDDYDAGIAILQEEYPNLKLICLSLGSEGSRAYYKNNKYEMPAYLQKETIETTGAGDTFCACMIDMILKNGLDDIHAEVIEDMLKTGNAAASIVTTRKGALRVMPSMEEVKSFLNNRK